MKNKAFENRETQVFDFWKGNNLFFWNGKIMFGPKSDFWYVQIFLSFIAIMTLTFYAFIIPNVVILNK